MALKASLDGKDVFSLLATALDSDASWPQPHTHRKPRAVDAWLNWQEII